MTTPRITCRGCALVAYGLQMRAPTAACSSEPPRLPDNCTLREPAAGKMLAGRSCNNPCRRRPLNDSHRHVSDLPIRQHVHGKNPDFQPIRQRCRPSKNCTAAQDHQRLLESIKVWLTRSRFRGAVTAGAAQSGNDMWICRPLRGEANRKALLEARPADNCTEPVCRKKEI